MRGRGRRGGAILQAELTAREGFTSAFEVGPGLARHARRGRIAAGSAGIADIERERVVVVSDGGFVEVGEPIRVVRVDGNRIAGRRRLRGKDEP